jgi:two-component system phosphate regulon sensor histidine kinase PhoR
MPPIVPTVRLLRPVIVAELIGFALFGALVITVGRFPERGVTVGLAGALAAAVVMPWGWWAMARQFRPLERFAQTFDQSLGEPPTRRVTDPQTPADPGGLWQPLIDRIAKGCEVLRQEERESRQRAADLASLLDTMIEGVIALDDRQRIRLTNQAAGELFGFDPRQATGKRVAELVRSFEVRQMVQHAMTGGSVPRAEMYVDFPRRRLLSVSVRPLPGSPPRGATLVAIDSSEVRRLESLRQDFVANVSHELKTPLSAIKAYAETLANGAIHDQRTNMKFVRGIEEQAERLHRLILDMLSLARIESGRATFELTPVDVDRVVKACVRDYQGLAAGKQIELSYRPGQPELYVRADEEGLREILNNLVDNAIKYTPPQGTVTVESLANPQEVILTVADTGIGIPAEHLDRLFERFYRVDKARSRQLGGTGLGLAIVKHLAHVFGGRVAVESVPRRGSRFSVHLVRASGDPPSGWDSSAARG